MLSWSSYSHKMSSMVSSPVNGPSLPILNATLLNYSLKASPTFLGSLMISSLIWIVIADPFDLYLSDIKGGTGLREAICVIMGDSINCEILKTDIAVRLLIYCRLVTWEHISVKRLSKYNNIHTWELIPKYCLQNDGHFISDPMFNQYWFTNKKVHIERYSNEIRFWFRVFSFTKLFTN